MMPSTQTTVPLTRIQKLIGSLMHESKQTKASGYLSVWADLTELAGMRKQYCRQAGVRVTTNDLILYAMGQAILRYPITAARLDTAAGRLVIPESIGLGFAVAAPQGLVVPVIQQAERKSLTQIAEAGDDLLRRARSNKLIPDDFEGATMVLSGLGMYGIEWFYAVAPPSATGIISIGFIGDQCVPAGEGVTSRKRMNISLAIDQRIVDDFTAGAFLRYLADRLEDPWSLVNEGIFIKAKESEKKV